MGPWERTGAHRAEQFPDPGNYTLTRAGAVSFCENVETIDKLLSKC